MGERAAGHPGSTRPRSDLTGVVLCGGRSSRMGTDKASIHLGGRPTDATLLERAAAALSEIAAETLLACGPTPRYADLGFPLVLDQREDAGPLAGLEAALARSRTEWIAALACDMPRVQAGVFLALLEGAEVSGLDAYLLGTEGGVEPLCAVYRKSCLAPVRAALDAGERKVTSFQHFFMTSGKPPNVGVLDEQTLSADLSAPGIARNLNTPADLAEWTQGRAETARRAEIGGGIAP